MTGGDMVDDNNEAATGKAMRFVSKPTEVEAMQWTLAGTGYLCAMEIVAWVKANGGEAEYDSCDDPNHAHGPGTRILVRTINGWAHAEPGHFVVMGSATFSIPVWSPDTGEDIELRDFYPCEPETFERRWERVS